MYSYWMLPVWLRLLSMRALRGWQGVFQVSPLPFWVMVLVQRVLPHTSHWNVPPPAGVSLGLAPDGLRPKPSPYFLILLLVAKL